MTLTQPTRGVDRHRTRIGKITLKPFARFGPKTDAKREAVIRTTADLTAKFGRGATREGQGK